jgi:MFS family permease
MSTWYFLPIYFQAVRGATPTRSGVLILPTVVVQAFVGVAAGYFMNLTGQRLSLIYAGMTLMTLGFGLFITLGTAESLIKIIVLEITAGVGVGLVFQAPLLALQSRTSPEHLAAGTALFGFVRSISTSISVVIGGSVFQNSMNRRVRSLRLTIPAEIISKFAGPSAVSNVALVSTLSKIPREEIMEAYAKSLQDMWILYACTAAVGLLVSFAIKSKGLEIDGSAVVGSLRKSPTQLPVSEPPTQEDIELEIQNQV